jgi:hypothetical protein
VYIAFVYAGFFGNLQKSNKTNLTLWNHSPPYLLSFQLSSPLLSNFNDPTPIWTRRRRRLF